MGCIRRGDTTLFISQDVHKGGGNTKHTQKNKNYTALAQLPKPENELIRDRIVGYFADARGLQTDGYFVEGRVAANFRSTDP